MTDINRDLFRDAFRYYEKYESVVMSADDFVRAARDMDDYIKKHGSTLLAQDLFGGIYVHFGNRWLEDKTRRARTNAGRTEQIGFQMVPEAQGEASPDAP